jgi:hypothetical protein
MSALGPARPSARPVRRPRVSFLRALRVAMAIGGVVTVAWLFFVIKGNGFDTYSYWRPPHVGPDLYSGTADPGGLGPFRYSPAFAQLVSPLWVLDFDAFLTLWTWLNVAAYLFVARRWWLIALGFVPVPFEFFDGNIHLLIAAALVASMRFPAAWAFIVLTKVTPGIGLLWFVVRREWRSLAIALGATAAVVAVSVAIGGPDLWVAWIRSLAGSQSAGYTPLGWLPLPIRLAMAAAIVIVGARRGWRWVLPIAVVLAIPSPWLHAFSILIACAPLGLFETIRAWQSARAARGGQDVREPAAPATAAAG